MYWSRLGTTSWDPFSEFRTLQREMNRLFSGYTPEQAAYPALNLWSNGDEAVVTAELPGVDPADISLNVVKNQLTIEGERKAETLEEDVVRHRAERGTGRFVRTIGLPFDVENEKVAASYKHGVLKITLPRAEATKPKRIEIAAG